MASTPKLDRKDDTEDDDVDDTDLDQPRNEAGEIVEEAPVTSPAQSRDTERDLAPPDSRSVTAKSRVVKSAKEDTLLSVDEAASQPPGPASDDDGPDPAVDELGRQVLQLEARIKVLEMQRGERPAEDRRWLFWVGLLFALALGWQLRAFFE